MNPLSSSLTTLGRPSGSLKENHNLKVDIHQKKAMLCCWWHSPRMLYHELLDDGTTVTANIYATQLQKLSEATSHA
ncbi:unnamed protein product [Heligmosomoides polygyrus]|uniref:Uncharacterized protein n=1 Tax=Heligmosomoides polygyrus TaxID=6339 RepID=A0A183G7W9_HELPZ|nr:unnamed protein product [Heligmosomoides polygyrus]